VRIVRREAFPDLVTALSSMGTAAIAPMLQKATGAAAGSGAAQPSATPGPANSSSGSSSSGAASPPASQPGPATSGARPR
jgi:hypothetical protein